MADLFALLHATEPIGSHFRNLLPDCMLPVEGPFLKNEVVLKTGETSKIAYWMPVGYARAYTLVPGKESWQQEQQTIGFWKAGELVVVSDSFFGQIPSLHHLEFAADTVLRSISYDSLQVMKQKTIETNELIAKILSADYRKAAERTDFLKLQCEKRYASFLQHFHERIEQSFELKHIASYLVMDPTTLSILRRNFLIFPFSRV